MPFLIGAAALQIVAKKGKLQRIHIMVCTYSEPVETVEACVQEILDSVAPCYTEKFIYLGDDGASIPKYADVSSGKLDMVRRLREKGFAPTPLFCLLCSCSPSLAVNADVLGPRPVLDLSFTNYLASFYKSVRVMFHNYSYCSQALHSSLVQ